MLHGGKHATPHGMGDHNKKLIEIPDEMTAFEFHASRHHDDGPHRPVLHDIPHAPVLDWHREHHEHLEHERHSPFHFSSPDEYHYHHQHDDPDSIHLPPELSPMEYYHHEMHPEDHMHTSEEHHFLREEHYDHWRPVHGLVPQHPVHGTEDH